MVESSLKSNLTMNQKKQYIKPSVERTEVLESEVLCISSIEFGGTIDFLDSPDSRDIEWEDFEEV